MSPVFAPCGAIAAKRTAKASSSWRRNSPARAFAGSTSRTTPRSSASGRWRTSPPSSSSATAPRSSTVPSSPTMSISGGSSRPSWRTRNGRKKPSDRVLDRGRGGAGVRRRADRPSDHDVVGTGGKGLRDIHGALLIVAHFSCLRALHRTNAGRYDEQSFLELGLEARGFEPGSDDAVAARRHGGPCAGENQLLERLRGAHFVEIALVEAGEHRHGEDLHRPLLARRSLHHRAVAVDGEERCAAPAHVGDRAAHGLGNVVELEVGEDLVAARGEPV